MSDVWLIARLKQDLEYARKDALEWHVLADLFEDQGNSDMAEGIRAWTLTNIEPTHWLGPIDLDQWPQGPYRYYANPDDGPYPWRWQSKPDWKTDFNFVSPDVFHRLNGRPFLDWACYTSRIEAILDYAQAIGRR